MSEELLYLGHPTRYWMELQTRADALSVDQLLGDLADLHAKVAYYELMFDRINSYRGIVDKK